jgi:peptidyl-prolyl cis-trans isomerase A (cyclophilin A)
MRLIPMSLRRRPRSAARAAYRTVVTTAIESLESRTMLDATSETGSAIAPLLANPTNAANDSINLAQYFTDSTLPGTLVTFNTSLGTIDVGLTDQATPLTVANFLSYVESGAYNGTFFHRSAFLSGTGTPSATTPSDIVQAGGYNISGGSLNTIATNAPVNDEYTTELYGDVAGTLAMAKTSYADSATDEFYFNENDNSQALDTPTTDPNGVTTSYTVFGQVLGSGSLAVVTAIASLPDANLGGALSTLPVNGLTQAQIDAGTQPNLNQLVYINSVTSEPGTSYTVTSDAPSLVSPTVTNGVLSFAYPGGPGTAEITVEATNLDGTSASETFPVTVPDATQPTQGPVVTASTSAPIVSGVQGQALTLTTATDSLSPLTTSGVAIVTPPLHGTATVDPTTGYIDYTSTAGFVGNDTLTYTVSDEAGAVSAPATLTLDVVPTSVQITIGTAAAKSLTFTESDNGAVGHLTVTGGTAVVTFSSYQVTTTTARGVVTATGLGAIISDITITNFKGQKGSLALNSASPVTIGSVNDTGDVSRIVAPNGTLTGDCTLGGLGYMNVAGADGMKLVAPGVNVRIMIGTATNSSVQGYGIGLIKSKQWLNTDGGTYQIYAYYLSQLDVTGTFADDLDLTNKGYDVQNATVGEPSGAWNLSGSLLQANLQTPASTWALTTGGIIQQLNVKGTLSNVIQAAAVSSVKVVGDTNGAVIQTDATYNKRFLQVGRISVTGAMTNSVIFSAGNIGTISAGSMSGSRIYAGVALATAQAGTLPTDLTDFTDNARITSVSVGNGASSFSESQINAETIGSLRLGGISDDSSGASEGIAAHTITSLSATLNGKTRLALNSTAFRATKTTASADVLTAYLTKKGITLPTGFVIDLY